MTAQMHLPRFYVRQQLTMMVNPPRLLPQGLRRQPAALDVPPQRPRARGHRPRAQRGRGGPARFVDLPFAFHFDFVDQQTGQVVMSSERQMTLRDRYTVTVPDPRIDFRLAASMAVAPDALLAR
jgi:hypothetical protein